jgi:hypothetical protein
MWAQSNQSGKGCQRDVLAEVLLNVISHQPHLPRSKPTTRRSLSRRLTRHDLAQFVSQYRPD